MSGSAAAAAAAAAASSSVSSSTSNPRKFSEKIALHKQKEAEEKADFEKLMQELNSIKGIPQQQQQPTNVNSQHLHRRVSGAVYVCMYILASTRLFCGPHRIDHLYYFNYTNGWMNE